VNTRASAAQALTLIVNDHRSIKPALESVQIATLEPRDKAFIQELVYGVCRWFYELESELEQILNKAIRKRDVDIKCLLLIGLYQMRHLQTPHHALVKETVDATLILKKAWARGFVNATLRTAIRKDTSADAPMAHHQSAARSNPEWLTSLVMKDWPAQAESIFEAYNQRPPLTLRVNQFQTRREDYLQTLKNGDVSCMPTQYSSTGVRIEPAISLDVLPGFRAGAVSVQDEAAQFAVELLAPTTQDTILDACAAPGGKTGHILEVLAGERSETADSAKLSVLDVDDSRLSLVTQNLTRLGFSARMMTGDARSSAEWWDGGLFSKILVDAPCSASGIIRRQPDIRIHRQASDIEHLSAVQGEILEALWPLLSAGGRMVYATCSIFREENDGVIKAFESRHADSNVRAISAEWGTATEFGRQILPGEANMDGFYYSVLEKD
jgi:16S rRNA (cytosine967-C5)-methyltransferase